MILKNLKILISLIISTNIYYDNIYYSRYVSNEIYHLITIAKKSYTNFSELNILIDYNLCHITW